MADVLLEQIISCINRGWPQHHHAKFEPRIGHHEQKNADGRSTITPWSNPEGFLTLQYNRPYNTQKPGSIYVSRGNYPTFESDHLDVTLLMDFGDVQSDSEVVRDRLDKYVEKRLQWLNDSKNYLDFHDQRFPITWTPLCFGSANGMRAEYHLYGKAEIPLDAFDQADDAIDEISRILLGGFNPREHPNDYDDYLYLNQKGYLNDSWTKSA